MFASLLASESGEFKHTKTAPQHELVRAGQPAPSPAGGMKVKPTSAKRMARHGIITAALFVASSSIWASQIVLTPSAVIGGSGAFGGAWNTGPAAGNVFDSQGPGPKYENSSPTGSPWMGRDLAGGEYFVVDLGAAYAIDHFDIFNTHNGVYGDRTTDRTYIYGANAVAAPGSCETGAGTCGLDLVGPVTSWTALAINYNIGFGTVGNDPINAITVSSLNNTNLVRYLRVEAIKSSYCCNGVGLNELQVFVTETPVPAAVWMFGSALGVLGLIRRKMRG